MLYAGHGTYFAIGPAMEWPYPRTIGNSPECVKEGSTRRVPAFVARDSQGKYEVPSMLISLDKECFEHFSMKLPPLQFEMFLGIYQNRTCHMHCAGKFYRLKKQPGVVVYIIMIGKQPKDVRSPILSSVSCAICKFHAVPPGLLQSRWAGKRENRTTAAKTKGVVILPLSELNCRKEVQVQELFDNRESATNWLACALSSANHFFADPIIHDEVVPHVTAIRFKFPRQSSSKCVPQSQKCSTVMPTITPAITPAKAPVTNKRKFASLVPKKTTKLRPHRTTEESPEHEYANLEWKARYTALLERTYSRPPPPPPPPPLTPTIDDIEKRALKKRVVDLETVHVIYLHKT